MAACRGRNDGRSAGAARASAQTCARARARPARRAEPVARTARRARPTRLDYLKPLVMLQQIKLVSREESYCLH